MTINIIPKALYPLVPKAPGVPALLRSGAQILDTATLGYLGIGDALNSIIGYPNTEWGVFNPKGAIFADYDSFNAMGYNNESSVSDYPVEQGGFASYNKVDAAYDMIVTLHCGGGADRRAKFLQACENARASLDTYSVLTPEKTYRNINFVDLQYRREETNGAYLLIVTLVGREIRNNTRADYSEPKATSAFKELDQGQLQPIDDVTIDTSGVV